MKQPVEMSVSPDNELLNEVILHFLLSAFCPRGIGWGIQIINALDVTIKELFNEIILINA